MGEILSQKEIDDLLNAVEMDDEDGGAPPSAGAAASPGGGPAEKGKSSVRMYDFKRPDKFTKEQIRTLQMIHETYARQATTKLSGQLRQFANMHVASVDQITFEEFSRSIPNPTTLAILDMEPLHGRAILEIDPTISFAILDRLFGGEGHPPKDNRELSEIEFSVLEGILLRLLGGLREAWSSFIDLRPKLSHVETNIQFAQIVPPNDMVVLITLETRLGDVEGMTNLCIPFITLESLLPRFNAGFLSEPPPNTKKPLLTGRVPDLPFHAALSFALPPLTLREVSELRPGSILPLSPTKIPPTPKFVIGGVSFDLQDTGEREGGFSFTFKARPQDETGAGNPAPSDTEPTVENPPLDAPSSPSPMEPPVHGAPAPSGRLDEIERYLESLLETEGQDADRLKVRTVLENLVSSDAKLLAGVRQRLEDEKSGTAERRAQWENLARTDAPRAAALIRRLAKRDDSQEARADAAILLMLLDPAIAAGVFGLIPEEELGPVVFEISRLDAVLPPAMERALRRTAGASGGLPFGGIDRAREILEQAVGAEKAVAIVNRLTESLQVKPFDFVRRADPQHLVNILQSELPQLVALVLAWLAPRMAAEVLRELPVEIQAEVAKRMAKMQRVAPEVLREIERVLERKLATLAGGDFSAAGGIDAVVGVLNLADRSTEKTIIETLEEEEPELAEEIKKRLFVFEDIVLLDDKSIQLVLQETSSTDLGKALRSVDDDVQEKIFRNMSKHNAALLREDMKFMGPVRMSDVEEAQQKIVDAVRRLEEDGKIHIARAGEDEMVV